MELRSTKVLRGSSLQAVAGGMLKAKTYGADRVCAVEGCGTRLSSYNPSSRCAMHGGAWQEDPRHSERKTSQREEISRRCAFAPCSREFATTNPAKKYCTNACRMKAFQARATAARRLGNLREARRTS